MSATLRFLNYNRRKKNAKLEVSTKVLPKLKTASVIAKAVMDQRGDIRDVISIGKLVRKKDGHEEVEHILRTLAEYGCKPIT